MNVVCRKLEHKNIGPGSPLPRGLATTANRLYAAGEDERRRLLGDESGQSTVLMTLFMATFLFGFVGLGIDTQKMFDAKRVAQASADAAAIAAGEEYSYGTSAEQTAANAIVTLNGMNTSAAKYPAVVTIGVPTSGNYSGNSAYIQAVVSQPIPTIFMNILNRRSTVTVSGRAVAGIGQNSPTCICLEGTSGEDLNLSNDASLSATGCGTTVDSTSSDAVGIVGGSTLGGVSLGIVSTTWTAASNVNNGGSISGSTKVVTGVASSCAPALPAAPTYSSAQCTADPISHYQGGANYLVGPNSGSYTTTQYGDLACYTSLTVGSNGDTVYLEPGIYVISNGELHFESGANNASNTGGNGVFFYLVGTASLVIDNGANVNLTAPSSGTYSGIVVFQDSADTAAISVQGGSNTSFNGAIFAPSSNVTLGNGSNTTLDADIVAKTLTMTGGTSLSGNATSNFGTFNLSVAKLTE
jgi:hypothetical protein